MAENLPKRQIAGDAKWLSLIARLNRRGGHGDISNEVIVGDDWRKLAEQLLWALSQLQRGCQNPILGLRAECWAPDPREAFIPIRPLQPGLELDELLQPNHTYYVHTAGGAITRWLPDAALSDGEVIEVKDVDGSAATYNITIKTTKGQTLDGASSKTISQAYGSLQIRSNGRQWYSMSNNAVAGVTDHGALTGLADDDHVGYMFVSGAVVDNAVAVYNGTGGRDLEDTPVTIDPANGNTAGIGTLASGAHTITQATVGNVVRTHQSTATNDDPGTTDTHNRVATTNATATTLHTITLATGKSYIVSAKVIGVVTTVDSGEVNEIGNTVGYHLRATLRNSAGTASIVGQTSDAQEEASMTTCACVFDATGATVRVRVTGPSNGASDTVMTWHLSELILSMPLGS